MLFFLLLIFLGVHDADTLTLRRELTLDGSGGGRLRGGTGALLRQRLSAALLGPRLSGWRGLARSGRSRLARS